ncbi:MAG: hypothetical protein WC314_17390 [Vulcanimicrobiota bacterium]
MLNNISPTMGTPLTPNKITQPSSHETLTSDIAGSISDNYESDSTPRRHGSHVAACITGGLPKMTAATVAKPEEGKNNIKSTKPASVVADRFGLDPEALQQTSFSTEVFPDTGLGIFTSDWGFAGAALSEAESTIFCDGEYNYLHRKNKSFADDAKVCRWKKDEPMPDSWSYDNQSMVYLPPDTALDNSHNDHSSNYEWSSISSPLPGIPYNSNVGTGPRIANNSWGGGGLPNEALRQAFLATPYIAVSAGG